MIFLCAVQLSSLKTETERIQSQKDQLQAELLASRTELEALRVALSHVQSTNKALSNDKVNLTSFLPHNLVLLLLMLAQFTSFCVSLR